MGSQKNNEEALKIVRSLNQKDYIDHMNKYMLQHHQDNKLRIKYNPKQMGFRRAL